RHVAVYVNKNIAKFYIDQHRIGILNQVLPGKATNLSIEVSNPEQPVMFKNFRLAAGGTDAYEKVITDGKFISYGIQFDVNKSLLKPESMGAINEVVKMLKSYPELKLEIGGHTDSDGSAERNNTLSQERANAVKKQMVSMGIDAARLTTKGYGSSKPIAENNSVENKARNRRVEFVRK
ncbi:MAG TPA: OmpA family protein, partial [Ginsengibacter sp.]|nr:OmpA family protein [Ginsengibacter sp.]